MVEREARCLALEQAYVHEVYHQMGGGDNRQHPPWPRVTQFLNQLEPGSLVCDVGCGNGKYLNVNPSVFKIGADRCSRLAENAKKAQNEVLVCDNLSLPFRDESFDAVLSIAVIHHFATAERRIGALKELARVLRIGGRLVISVWAMEQRHRKFESQDVLVPWHRPKTLSTPSLELTPTTTTSEEDSHHHFYAACMHTSDSDSCPSARGSGGRQRSRCKHKEVIPSPSSSSLSSPNESCYSFVRRALKKLAGGKRGGARSRPWFLDSWTSCASKEPPSLRYDPDGCEDIQDLPIELRRLEEDVDIPLRKGHLTCPNNSTDIPLNQKSKSLTDIIVADKKTMVRSQSSVPSLEIHKPKNEHGDMVKPRLVKQKQSVCCDDDVESEERDKAMDMRNMVKSLPEFKIAGYTIRRRGNVFKQSSMNEELMSTERLREKEKVRQNIQKQASLNEELIYNRNNKTLDSLRDTLFSTSTAKRFQLLKDGLTNKIKNSTTGIEKVAGASIKNGFVRILQGWTSSDSGTTPPKPPPQPQSATENKSFIFEKKDQPCERRHSREDGSDSSKDSSLQSDTSVDSEDSFASVIFIPKSDQIDPQSTNTSPTLQSTPASPQPTSPKIKCPPPISPKLKTASQIPFVLSSHPSSPKIKHPGQLISSTTPTSPKYKYFPQPTSPRAYQSNFLTSPTSRTSFKHLPSPNGTYTSQTNKIQIAAKMPLFDIPLHVGTSPTDTNVSTCPSYLPPPKEKDINIPQEEKETEELDTSSKLEPFKLASIKDLPKKDAAKLKKEITLPPTCVVSVRPQFPLVKRSASISGQSDSPPCRSVPRLLSLEIFNPEIDDMDSDSSGLSSPDSIGSVISIKNDEESGKTEKPEAPSKNVLVPSRISGVGAEGELKLAVPDGNSKLSPLLEAAAGVASSLEETVDTVIQSSPQAKRKLNTKTDPMLALQDCTLLYPKDNEKSIRNTHISNANESTNDFDQNLQSDEVSEKRWDEECRQHLADFAEKLSEKLLAEIDRYREQTSNQPTSPILLGNSSLISDIQDPYLCKLSEDLHDLTRLSIELANEGDKRSMRIREFSGTRIKAEGANAEEKHIENAPKRIDYHERPLISIAVSSPIHTKRTPVEIQTAYFTDDQMPLLENCDASVKPDLDIKTRLDEVRLINTSTRENSLELSDSESTESDGNWTDSRRNTILPGKCFLTRTLPLSQALTEGITCQREETTRIELLPGKDMPRRPSISIEMSEPLELSKESEELISDCILHLGISLESSEAGDNISERTGSSSEGSRPGSRRETIQISDSGSILSLRPGLSIESSDAGDFSDKAGSDGSRDSRRDTVSFSDVTSGSQNSLLRPGHSIESSDAGDVSDYSRQNTSSAGKTPSTASFNSDRASDCSKDATFADRRMARCDGRSSSEEMPLPRSCMNKLVRQRASTQEPCATLTKAKSLETSLSGSTSQDSLLSDSGGGAITFHRYYHVFKEGELDQLIERYVENLHIISSYYDHANWCVIAEKVQVWTI